MANLSDTDGNVIAYAATKENAEKVLRVIHREASTWEFHFDIWQCKEGCSLEAHEENGRWKAASSFCGTGKNSFVGSLEGLSESLGDAMNELDFEFDLTFNFRDYEPVRKLLYCAEMRAHHEPGSPELRFVMWSHFDLDFNASNVRRVGLGDAPFDLNDPKDELIERFIDIDGEARADDIRAVFGNSKALERFKREYDGVIFDSSFPDTGDIEWKRYLMTSED